MKNCHLLIVVMILISSCQSEKTWSDDDISNVPIEDITELTKFCHKRIAENKGWVKASEAAAILTDCVGSRRNQVVFLLIGAGVPIDGVKGRMPPSAVAVRANNAEMLSYLILHSADVNIVWSDEGTKESLLNYAYLWNSGQCIGVLLKSGASKMPSSDSYDLANKKEWLRTQQSQLEGQPTGRHLF